MGANTMTCEACDGIGGFPWGNGGQICCVCEGGGLVDPSTGWAEFGPRIEVAA